MITMSRGSTSARNVARLLMSMTLVAAAVPASDGSPQEGAVVAAPDGHGAVELFWLSSGDLWPAGGWTVERLSGGQTIVLVEALGPGADGEAMTALDPDDAKSILVFAERLDSGSMSAEQQGLAGLIFGMKAALDPVFGRALGVRWTDTAAGVSSCRYRVTGLDDRSRAIVTLESPEISTATVPPPPVPPRDLRAATGRNGVELFWADPPDDAQVPVVGFLIERLGSDGRVGLRTPRPVARMLDRDPEAVAYLDPLAPPEAEAVYRVRNVDLFARTSDWAELRFFVEDLAARFPPLDFQAEAGENRVRLSWTPSDNPHTAGYLISSAPMRDGPYSLLTAKPLPASTGEYEDRDLQGGVSRFYRLQAVGTRGDLGSPSAPVRAIPINREPPPAPGPPDAEVGRTRVRLTWAPLDQPVAGYFVERQVPGDRWARLGSDVTSVPSYDDHVGPRPGGRFAYRVVAIGLDGRRSQPSQAAEVELLDVVPPPSPEITRIDGSGGSVELRFRPSSPEQASDRFLILRGGPEDATGLVIGQPLAADARSFTDDAVRAGDLYWYSVVALDAAGNRSEPGRSAIVLVGSPELPAPDPPRAELVTEPFLHVRIEFAEPPHGLSVVVHRRASDDEPWWLVAGPLRATEVIDLHPPAAGDLEYRILYQAANDDTGPPSGSARITR